MKLLIVTQAVDTEDSVLGFFVRWIEELAKHCEQVEVICLKEGKHVLPANVRVYSLGKERGVSRIGYVLNFYRYIWRLRRDYNAVFVHMNQEYALFGGLFWRLSGKKIILWRNHKMGSWLTGLAAAFSDTVCYTSPDAFVARYPNAIVMPIGIDTDFFTPPSAPAPGNSILFLGRLDSVKKVREFVNSLAGVPIPFYADLYGSPTQPDSAYAREVIEEARPLVEKRALMLHHGVSYGRTKDLYQAHAVYVNLTPSGSFDKTIGEAAAAGCVVVCANSAMRGVVSPALLVRDDDLTDIARGISVAIGLSAQERTAEAKKLRSYVEQEHSLTLLMMKMRTLL